MCTARTPLYKNVSDVIPVTVDHSLLPYTLPLCLTSNLYSVLTTNNPLGTTILILSTVFSKFCHTVLPLLTLITLQSVLTCVSVPFSTLKGLVVNFGLSPISLRSPSTTNLGFFTYIFIVLPVCSPY